MPAIELILLVGKYAQNHYLDSRSQPLAETLYHWPGLCARIFPAATPLATQPALVSRPSRVRASGPAGLAPSPGVKTAIRIIRACNA
jgi:hypothetical protein